MKEYINISMVLPLSNIAQWSSVHEELRGKGSLLRRQRKRRTSASSSGGGGGGGGAGVGGGATLNFFGDGDPSVFNIADYSFVSGSYNFIQVSSTVIMRLRNSSPSRSKRSTCRREHSIFCFFWYSDNICGINLAQPRLILTSQKHTYIILTPLNPTFI